MRAFIALVALGISQANAQATVELPPPPPEPTVIFDCPTAMSDIGRLSPSDAEFFLHHARQGDAYAAFRLAYHFGSNTPEGEYWENEAAKLGNPNAQFNRWFALQNASDCRTLREAAQWLTRSAAQKDASAIAELPKFRANVESKCGVLP